MTNFKVYILFFRRKVQLFLLLLITTFALSSCGKIWNPADARKVPTNVEERAKQAIEEGRGITFGGALGKGGTANYDFATSNPMWRATLEILDFLPLSNVDYAGGFVSTDWYNEGTSNNESIKITVRFLSNEIRADGIKIIVHKKACSKLQNCTIKKISSVLEDELKVAILRQATLFEKNLTDRKRKEYKKKFGEKQIRDRTTQ